MIPKELLPPTHMNTCIYKHVQKVAEAVIAKYQFSIWFIMFLVKIMFLFFSIIAELLSPTEEIIFKWLCS